MHVLDIRIDEMNKRQAINQVGDFLRLPDQYKIFTPNPEMIVKAQRDEYFKKILNNGDLNLCDGFGVKLAALISGRSLVRVTGVDFMIDVCGLAAEQGKGVYLLGSGDDRVVSKACEELSKKFPTLKISGYNKGPEITEGLAKQLDEGILEEICNSGAQILFVAFGMGKQEKWIYENLSKLPNIKVAMGVGGSFDFISGKIKRAPLFLRKLGLEWLYRLIQEPRRIGRIFNATVRFGYLIFKSKI